MAMTEVKPTGAMIPSSDRLVSITESDGSPQSRCEPLSLEEARQQLRNPPTSDNDLIRGWIAAARAIFEELTGRQLINAEWEYALDQPPAYSIIELPRPPLVSVNSIVYDDGDGNEVTLSAEDYTVQKSGVFDGSPASGVLDEYCGCGSVQVAGLIWPTTSGLARSFRIRRTCGYGDTPEEIPGAIKAVLYFLVGHFYRNRSEVSAETLKQLPMGADALIKAFKYRAIQTLPPRCT